MAEPLAAAVHAIARAPGRPLAPDAGVLGGGPMGQMLAALLVAEGRTVTVADRHAERRAQAEAAGAMSAERLADHDVVFEAVGRPDAWRAAVQACAPGGCVVFVGGCEGRRRRQPADPPAALRRARPPRRLPPLARGGRPRAGAAGRRRARLAQPVRRPDRARRPAARPGRRQRRPGAQVGRHPVAARSRFSRHGEIRRRGDRGDAGGRRGRSLSTTEPGPADSPATSTGISPPGTTSVPISLSRTVHDVRRPQQHDAREPADAEDQAPGRSSTSAAISCAPPPRGRAGSPRPVARLGRDLGRLADAVEQRPHLRLALDRPAPRAPRRCGPRSRPRARGGVPAARRRAPVRGRRGSPRPGGQRLRS